MGPGFGRFRPAKHDSTALAEPLEVQPVDVGGIALEGGKAGGYSVFLQCIHQVACIWVSAGCVIDVDPVVGGDFRRAARLGGRIAASAQ